jgi:hypothetical protein
MNTFYKIYTGLCKSIIIASITFGLPTTGFGQSFTPGCLAALGKDNGFKEIKLGADVSKLPGYKLYYLDNDENLDADSCFKFEYRDQNILDLNGLLLDLVGIRTYHKKVTNIYLFFKRDDGYKILKKFEAVYGDCTAKPGAFMYDWQSSNVNLSLRYQAASDLGVAIFTCNAIDSQLAEQRKKAKQLTTLLLSAVDFRSL